MLPKIPVITVIVAGSMFLFIPGLMPIINAETTSLSYTYLLYGLCCFLVVYGAVSINNLWGYKLPKYIVYLGGALYSLYLAHPLVAPLSPVLFNMLHIKQPVLSVIFSIALSLIAGTIFNKFCEQPIRNYLTRVVKNRTAA